jgi:NADH-quinone oxidoreductase subunit H
MLLVTLTFLLYKFGLVLVFFLVTLGIAAYSTWGERKFAAYLQDRIGPDRAGPFGLFQPLADGGKMFFKEEFIPAAANKWLFILGPGLFMMTALLTGCVIPWTRPFIIGGESWPVQITDINIGLLYLLGVMSIGVYGIMIGGWASNNKFALLGALRASSQMISYELAMGLAIIALVMQTGTLSLGEIVDQQTHVWNIFKQPLGFLIFIVCAFAECNRAPFDLPESESELVGGYHTEYTSMKLGLYLFAEYINMFISSAVMSSLYFGGYHLPFESYLVDFGLSNNTLAVLGLLAFFTKTIFFILVFMWVRWTLPRFRYDQLMNLGWKSLFPLALFNIVLTGMVYMIMSGQFKGLF